MPINSKIITSLLVCEASAGETPTPVRRRAIADPPASFCTNSIVNASPLPAVLTDSLFGVNAEERITRAPQTALLEGRAPTSIIGIGNVNRALVARRRLPIRLRTRRPRPLALPRKFGDIPLVSLPDIGSERQVESPRLPQRPPRLRQARTRLAAAEDPYPADLDKAFADIAATGATTVRTWGFNEVTSASGTYYQIWSGSTPTINYGADGLQKFDQVVASAKAHGLKLIVALTNNWADYGGMDVYVK
ncbi:hypothetical protein FRB90_005175 [Tulasnella sp. 427]|nr:hypothetical protein FRB90_005175 [Tulasnella sp. 427]